MQAGAATLAEARSAQSAAEKILVLARSLYADLQRRREAVEQKLATVREIYNRSGFHAPPDDPVQAEQLLFAEQDNLLRLEPALANLEASNAIDRVKALEARVASLRERADQEASKLNVLEGLSNLHDKSMRLPRLWQIRS